MRNLVVNGGGLIASFVVLFVVWFATRDDAGLAAIPPAPSAEIAVATLAPAARMPGFSYADHERLAAANFNYYIVGTQEQAAAIAEGLTGTNSIRASQLLKALEFEVVVVPTGDDVESDIAAVSPADSDRLETAQQPLQFFDLRN